MSCCRIISPRKRNYIIRLFLRCLFGILFIQVLFQITRSFWSNNNKMVQIPEHAEYVMEPLKLDTDEGKDEPKYLEPASEPVTVKEIDEPKFVDPLNADLVQSVGFQSFFHDPTKEIVDTLLRESYRFWYEKYTEYNSLELIIQNMNISERNKKRFLGLCTLMKISEMFTNQNIEDNSDYEKELAGNSGKAVPMNLLLSSFRCGSSFLGEFLNSYPGTFYHYEPYIYKAVEQIKSKEDEEEAVKIMRDVFQCKFQGNDKYLAFQAMLHSMNFSGNKRLWKLCTAQNRKDCFNPDYLEPMCKRFPVQLMKTVRLRLKSVQPLLEDRSLNLKVVLLIRDPRGMYSSRMSSSFWCKGYPDCDNPVNFCNDMISDYHAAKYIKNAYPGRLKILRYEDFCANIKNESNTIMKFFDLEYTDISQKYLDKHNTNKSMLSYISYTQRDIKKNPFKWRTKLSYRDIIRVQNSCETAMKLWGYKMVDDNSDLEYFNPMEELEI